MSERENATTTDLESEGNVLQNNDYKTDKVELKWRAKMDSKIAQV